MTPVRSSGSTFPVAGCDCSRFAMTSEASASLVVAKRRPGRGSSLRSGPARIQQCKTALCLDGGRVWDAEVSQVQLNKHRFVRQELLSWVSGSPVRQCEPAGQPPNRLCLCAGGPVYYALDAEVFWNAIKSSQTTCTSQSSQSSHTDPRNGGCLSSC